MVQQLTIDDIMSLRVRVLRQGTPATDAHYPEDEYPDVVHFGIVQAGDVIATSTWFIKECPEAPGVLAMQLKGMAVDASLQSGGYGAQLIQAGVALATERNADIVWARARDSALGFYEKCGFHTVGDGFIDEPTAMPHHIVVRELSTTR
jgi:GNAT superfamily N-acetyltransferase